MPKKFDFDKTLAALQNGQDLTGKMIYLPRSSNNSPRPLSRLN